MLLLLKKKYYFDFCLFGHKFINDIFKCKLLNIQKLNYSTTKSFLD